MSEIYITPEETAQMLFVSEQTLAVWRSKGRYDLPYIKFGWKVRYLKKDVEEFIKKRTRNRNQDKQACIDK